MRRIFVKQSHTDFKILFGIVFLICLALTIPITARNHKVQYNSIVFTILMLIICTSLSKLLNSFGLYIDGENIYYKKISRHKVNLSSICAIKIIIAETDGKFGRRTIRDVHGNPMYSMIFLSDVEKTMYNYQQGDIMFLHEFRDCVCFYTVWDESALEHITTIRDNIEIIR